MKHCNFISSDTGCMALVDALLNPEFGKILRITNVPNEVDAAVVQHKVFICVFIRAHGTVPFAPVVVPWGKIENATQGQIIRY